MARTAIGTRSKPKPPRLRLLIVDDSTEGRHSLGRLLELHGFEVACVADGSSALAHLRTGPVPDAVLTDLFLPDLDGRVGALPVEAVHCEREAPFGRPPGKIADAQHRILHMRRNDTEIVFVERDKSERVVVVGHENDSGKTRPGGRAATGSLRRRL